MKLFDWVPDNKITTNARMIYTEFESSKGYKFINKTVDYFKYDISVKYNIYGKQNIFEFEQDLLYCSANDFLFPVYNIPVKINNIDVENKYLICKNMKINIVDPEIYITKLEVNGLKFINYSTLNIYTSDSEITLLLDDISNFNIGEYIYLYVPSIITSQELNVTGKNIKTYDMGVITK